MTKFKKFALLCTAILASFTMVVASSCACFEPNDSSIEKSKYIVTFKNDDGTVLQESMVEEGEMPVYNGDTPTKAEDAQFTYTFAGWDKIILEVTDEATYTATYLTTTKKYVIKFVNEDGTVLQSSELEYGAMPIYEGTPTMKPNAPYSYVFIGWDKTIAEVTGDVTYTAKYDYKFFPEDAKDNFVDLEDFK